MTHGHGTIHPAPTATPHGGSTAAVDERASAGPTRAEGEQWWMRGLEEPLLHPARLLIMSTLVSDDVYRAGYLGDAAGIPRTMLIRHIRRLRDAGYLRSARGAYNVLWIWLTPDGRQRLTDHVTALNALLDSGRAIGQAAPTDAVYPRGQRRH